MTFIRGEMFLKFMVDENIIPEGAQDVKIEADITGSPMMITTTFMATEEDAKKIMGYEFVADYLNS